jgi:hypothetical protein
VKRPHEDPACKCAACEAYDNRGSDVDGKEFRMKFGSMVLTIQRMSLGNYVVAWTNEIEKP